MSKLFKKMLLSVTAVFVLVVFNAYLVEAKSLKKGEVYRSLDGEAMEVISSNELEMSEKGEPTVLAEYDFKGDKLRVVANVMGTKMVQYYLLTNEGLKEEETGQVFYSKAAFKAALAASQNFTDNGNGTVTQGTGLMWQKKDDNHKRTWEDAISYCKGLSLGGYSDWRLPNIGELKSIIDTRNKPPTINTTYFPNTNSSDYWSSTKNTDPAGMFDKKAWYVNFFNGGMQDDYFLGSGYVRCVRGGR